MLITTDASEIFDAASTRDLFRRTWSRPADRALADPTARINLSRSRKIRKIRNTAFRSRARSRRGSMRNDLARARGKKFLYYRHLISFAPRQTSSPVTEAPGGSAQPRRGRSEANGGERKGRAFCCNCEPSRETNEKGQGEGRGSRVAGWGGGRWKKRVGGSYTYLRAAFFRNNRYGGIALPENGAPHAAVGKERGRYVRQYTGGPNYVSSGL